MTDILEQAREIVEAEIMRQYKAHPEWDEAKDVVENIDCKTIASAILALAEPKWREIDDEACDGRWILGGWHGMPLGPVVVRGGLNREWSDVDDVSYNKPDLYMPIIPLPPKEGQR